MDEHSIQAIEKDVADWQYLKELPSLWHGFILKIEMSVENDIYYLFSYSSDELHRKIIVYYHDETKEYKLREKIGLTEFYRLECISNNFSMFEKLLKIKLENILVEMEHYSPDVLSWIVLKKNITNWDYCKYLPEEYNGFSLFINPHEPVRITNGSYIICDYEDFSCNCNFVIFYNTFRDEFFSEAKINNIAEMNYLFDAPTITELEKKITQYLFEMLDTIHKKANNLSEIENDNNK